MYHFNLYIVTNPYPMLIVTDINLLEMYKAALASGATYILWEKGVLDLTQIIGIMDLESTAPKDK